MSRGSVVFHPLSIRPDGDSWVIGRVETGEFAAMPAVAHRVITLLSGGRTVEEATSALRAETGTDFAVADFVAALDELGFVSAVDGQPRPGADPPAPSLPWLRPRHVRWTLHPVTAGLALALAAAAAAQDAAGCVNLYADGSAYVRYLARRLAHRQIPGEPDPALALPPRERRAVRAYSWLLVGGTAASLAVAAFVTIPAGVVLIAHAAAELASAAPVGRLDGAAAAVVLLGFQILWLRTWWRRHGGRVRGYLRPRAGDTPKGGELNGAREGRGAHQARADRDPQARQDRDHGAELDERRLTRP